jgi:hypothetical protein
MEEKMHLWPILFVVVLVALIAGLSLCYLAGVLIEGLNNQPRLDCGFSMLRTSLPAAGHGKT